MSYSTLATTVKPKSASFLLTLARLGWLVFFGLTLAVLVMAIPARWVELTQPTAMMLGNLRAVGWPVTFYAAYSLTTELIFMFVYLGVGLIIFMRRSDDGMALFTSLMLIAFGAGNQTITPTIGALRPYGWGLLAFQFLGYAAWVTFTQFPFIFPSGRFAPQWSVIPALIWFLVCIPWNFMAGSALDPLTWPPAIFGPIFVAMWASFLISQAYRYARVSGPVERQQTKLVFYALAMVVANDVVIGLIGFLFDWRALSYLLEGEPPTPQLTLFVLVFQGISRVSFLLIPLAFAFSILRYRLWDIDLVIRRTLAYSALTTVLALLYFGSILLLQSIFTAVTGQQSAVAVVISTLTIAALFVPLRGRVQTFIDQRFYRRKYDAAKTLAEFSATARDETNLDRLTAQLAAVVQETMQPEGVGVWLKSRVDKPGPSGNTP